MASMIALSLDFNLPDMTKADFKILESHQADLSSDSK